MIEFKMKDEITGLRNNVQLSVEQRRNMYELVAMKIRENNPIATEERYYLGQPESSDTKNNEKLNKLNALLEENKEQFSKVKDLSEVCDKLVELYN